MSELARRSLNTFPSKPGIASPHKGLSVRISLRYSRYSIAFLTLVGGRVSTKATALSLRVTAISNNLLSSLFQRHYITCLKPCKAKLKTTPDFKADDTLVTVIM